MTEGDVSALMNSVGVVVREYVAKATEPLLALIEKQAEQIKMLALQRTPILPDVAQIVAEQIAQLPKAAEVDYDSLIARQLAALPALAELKTAIEAAHKRNDAMFDEVCMTDDGIKQASAAIAELKARPVSPSSFLLDDAGELVAVYPDGATKAIGTVRGKDGKAGASVMDGRVDEAGQLVLRMSDGRVLNAGIVRGKDGVDAKGDPGKPGRDALEVRVLPGIDESKSYPEGTCALYRGGTIRAERETDPIDDGDLIKAGWRVALDGIAEEDEQQLNDGRILEKTTVYTSGRRFARSFVTHSQIPRGIFKAGTEYEQCDVVTWDGSQWLCERPNTKAEPGNGGDWKLIVKRGSPGRDAQPVKGDPGPPGRPGRDLTQLGPNGSKY